MIFNYYAGSVLLIGLSILMGLWLIDVKHTKEWVLWLWLGLIVVWVAFVATPLLFSLN